MLGGVAVCPLDYIRAEIFKNFLSGFIHIILNISVNLSGNHFLIL